MQNDSEMKKSIKEGWENGRWQDYGATIGSRPPGLQSFSDKDVSGKTTLVGRKNALCTKDLNPCEKEEWLGIRPVEGRRAKTSSREIIHKWWKNVFSIPDYSDEKPQLPEGCARR